MEKVGPKSVARDLYQRRKVQMKAEGFCLAEARETRRREKAQRFQDVATRYLAWSRTHLPRSLAYRATILRQLGTVFGQQPLGRITSSAVAAYLTRRQGEVSASTVNHERGMLRNLFHMAERWGLVHPNPVTATDRLPVRNEHPRPLTPDEEARLFAAVPAHYHPWMVLALHTGLRLGELRAQRWEDIDLAGSTLEVTQPKSGKREVLPLNDVAFSVLAALPQTSGGCFLGFR